tara:strand:- start:16615 stop:19218 length:2604 start_codon:yes stop_codon:yes gene_type:complete
MQNYWSKPLKEIFQFWQVDPKQGLSAKQVEDNFQRYGPNLLRRKKSVSLWLILWRQLKSFIVVLLFFAAVFSMLQAQYTEAIAIIGVLVINTAIGFVMEWRATRSMEALRKLGHVVTKVFRQSRLRHIDADELVPGDIVLLEAGDVVTADMRLLEASRLQVSEAALTGESVPIDKDIKDIPEDTILAERSNCIFKGTAIRRGTAKAIVIHTGMQSELGQISTLTEEAKEEVTPLEKKLDRLGRKLIGLTILIAILVMILGLIGGKDLGAMIATAIALAVAAIPEGLPIVATIALAKGMWLMSRRNALINHLAAVETLGSVTTICTDKTGTLTENEMYVSRFAFLAKQGRIQRKQGSVDFFLEDKLVNPLLNEDYVLALQIGLLCSNSVYHPNKQEAVGDPTELALLMAAYEAGLKQDVLYSEKPRQREIAFEADTRMMATYHLDKGKYFVAVKGASEAVLSCCRFSNSQDLVEMQKQTKELASEGLRVLALAYKYVEDLQEPAYENLNFVALVGMQDPPRHDVKQAIGECKRAGIRVIMMTGDQAETAVSIAEQVGLSPNGKACSGAEIEHLNTLPGEIFYRVNPKQKLDLVALLQSRQEVVAMTGDGVNDAPALKKADIGIAMGIRGTEVAKEASDMILKDDRFATIVEAIKQGRVIFNNIRKFVVYLLSCNLSEVLVVGLAAVINTPLPILPLQILFLNLVTDVFPALALGLGEGDSGVLRQRPRRKKEAILSRNLWVNIIAFGVSITFAVLTAFYIALYQMNLSLDHSITIAFMVLGFAQIFHVFNMKDRHHHFFKNDVFKSPYVWGAVVLCSLLMVATVNLELLRKVLSLSEIDLDDWLFVIAFSLLPVVFHRIYSIFTHKGE